MLTGEDRRFANPDGKPSSHVACVVEMANTMTSCNNFGFSIHHLNFFIIIKALLLCKLSVEVAIVDEIQMMRDVQRGWAFSRALLGLNADEIHVCGEAAGVSLVEELCQECFDDFEVVHYNRLTRLKVLSRGVGENEAFYPKL